MAEPIVRATEYTVSVFADEEDINAHSFDLTVSYRGRGLWAVARHRMCLNTAGGWDWEIRPSEREDDWLAEHRFPLERALELAKAAAPDVVVNGFRAAEVAAR